MPRVHANSGAGGAFDTELPELTLIRLRLREIHAQPPSAQFPKAGPQVDLTWEAIDYGDGDDTRPWVRDWPNAKVGVNNSGTPSKMRTLINALTGRAPGDHVEWFHDGFTDDSYTAVLPEGDPERFAFGLVDKDTIDGQIAVGVMVAASGEAIETTDSSGNKSRKLRIKSYRPVAAATPPATAAPARPAQPAPRASRPAPQPVAAGDIVDF